MLGNTTVVTKTKRFRFLKHQRSNLLSLCKCGGRSLELLGISNGSSAFPQEQTKGEISLILGEKEGPVCFRRSYDPDVCS